MGSRRRYIVWNGATAALTAFLAPVTTGTSLKTMLQVKPTTNISVIAWGYSFDAVPTAQVKVELITTGTVNATVTAYAAGDVVKYDDAGTGASAISLGTSASGFTSSAEGTVTASRLLAGGSTWAQQFSEQFPLDREPGVVANDILRIRATTSVAIGMSCWLAYEE
ncbi:hypothetical protein JGU71_28110 [Antrihabitans sp. YC3-6]|uniref:Uncharacterized protein n=1 Tax=Antrihabitans stalagmiti TaxID=2799499 RepID=A0A934NWT6_9NOCA|nr:hypothetical protein [Antrihabitans stalagmiti]MBJ8342760.1 hypothetical protein [Antrihabitans stalagmiti]